MAKKFSAFADVFLVDDPLDDFGSTKLPKSFIVFAVRLSNPPKLMA